MYTPVEPLRFPPTTPSSAQTSLKQESLYWYNGESRRIKPIYHMWPSALTHQNHWFQFWPWVPFLALSRETFACPWSPWSMIVLAINHWILSKFTIEEFLFLKSVGDSKITGLSRTFTVKSRVFHALFTLKSRLSFFSWNFTISNLSVKISLSTTNSHISTAHE